MCVSANKKPPDQGRAALAWAGGSVRPLVTARAVDAICAHGVGSALRPIQVSTVVVAAYPPHTASAALFVELVGAQRPLAALFTAEVVFGKAVEDANDRHPKAHHGTQCSKCPVRHRLSSLGARCSSREVFRTSIMHYYFSVVKCAGE